MFDKVVPNCPDRLIMMGYNLYKHSKWTKNKYKEWCKKEATKPALSREGWVRIIKDKKDIFYATSKFHSRQRNGRLTI